MTVDERERENLSYMLQAMAVDRIHDVHADGKVAEFLLEAANRVARGGSMAELTQRSYWHVRAIVGRDWLTQFCYVWRLFAEMECVPADVLRDIAAGCCCNANRYWSNVNEVIVRLCDNTAIPHDVFCELDSRFGGEGSDLPELGACNPRYANEIARKLILDRPEGFSSEHDVPRRILDGVSCGAVTDEEVLAFLCEPREWSTEYAGEPEYAESEGAWSEWTKSDASKLRERLGC